MLARTSIAALAACLLAAASPAATFGFEWVDLDWPDAAITATGELETNVEEGEFAIGDVTAFFFGGTVTMNDQVYTFSYGLDGISDVVGHIGLQTLLFNGATSLYDAEGLNVGTLELIGDGDRMGGYAAVGDTLPVRGLFISLGVTPGEPEGETGEPNGVPEPASWAMMLAGFGAIGAAMRGRRRVAVRFG